MSQKLRQEEILRILGQNGYATVRELVEILHYSSATVNRDLNAMQTMGLVQRSYGGVEAVDRSHYMPLPQRQLYMRKEKRRSARVAAELIENGETVFIDGSTSLQFIAPFLAEKRDVRVITNSIRLALQLGEYDLEVISLGGRISERPHVLMSEETIENAMRYHADKMFFSINQITADGRVFSTGNYYLFYRTLLKNSAQSYLLTDHSKLVDRLKETLCDFSALTGVISDFEFSEETRNAYPDTQFFFVKE